MRSFVLSRARVSDYPGIFHEVSQMLGEEKTAKLVAEYGGTHVYIARKLTPENKLLKLLGQEVAEQMAGEFYGLTVEIPRGVKALSSLRNEKIRADKAAGMSQRELARKYQLTERTIRKITSSQQRKEEK